MGIVAEIGREMPPGAQVCREVDPGAAVRTLYLKVGSLAMAPHL